MYGINDNITALTNLSETLFNCRVLPYYLHLLDRVQGAAHFEVKENKAMQLLEQMRIQLPGYLVPKMVREVSCMPQTHSSPHIRCQTDSQPYQTD